MGSIMQSEKECYITGRKDNLHKHHIFGGPNRRLSEKYGLYVWLIPELHNMSDKGVHFNKPFDVLLKRMGQIEFEYTYNHIMFMKIFGRNYL